MKPYRHHIMPLVKNYPSQWMGATHVYIPTAAVPERLERPTSTSGLVGMGSRLTFVRLSPFLYSFIQFYSGVRSRRIGRRFPCRNFALRMQF